MQLQLYISQTTFKTFAATAVLLAVGTANIKAVAIDTACILLYVLFIFTTHVYIGFIESKKESKDRESIQSSTTPDPGYHWESDNFTIIHHKREPRGQPFPSR